MCVCVYILYVGVCGCVFISYMYIKYISLNILDFYIYYIHIYVFLWLRGRALR